MNCAAAEDNQMKKLLTMTLLALTLALGVGGWYGRAVVPPASLWLTEVAVSSDRQGRQAAHRAVA